MRDFTLQTYSELIKTLKSSGYNFYTFEEWCLGNLKTPYVILRHDVDKLPVNSLKMAELEHSMQIRSVYYFRMGKNLFDTVVIQKIAALGHEIGYHYNDLVESKGNFTVAIQNFEKNLNIFRHYCNVQTIAMHGSPLSVWDNKELWKRYRYTDFSVIGEPYFDMFINYKDTQICYLTDTGRMWDGQKFSVWDIAFNAKSLPVHTTNDFIDYIRKNAQSDNMMITTHPQRWTDDLISWIFELITQTIKNQIKRLIRPTRFANHN